MEMLMTVTKVIAIIIIKVIVIDDNCVFKNNSHNIDLCISNIGDEINTNKRMKMIIYPNEQGSHNFNMCNQNNINIIVITILIKKHYRFRKRHFNNSNNDDGHILLILAMFIITDIKTLIIWRLLRKPI